MVFASIPVTSDRRFAARPVGAASRIRMPRKARIMPMVVVLLPVPGPPVRIMILLVLAVSMAWRCTSSYSMSSSVSICVCTGRTGLPSRMLLSRF